jgi:hypothetical protein
VGVVPGGVVEPSDASESETAGLLSAALHATNAPPVTTNAPAMSQETCALFMSLDVTRSPHDAKRNEREREREREEQEDREDQEGKRQGCGSFVHQRVGERCNKGHG